MPLGLCLLTQSDLGDFSGKKRESGLPPRVVALSLFHALGPMFAHTQSHD